MSVDTTMGLTPLEGLMMGTRSGSVDPAIIGHVADATGKHAKEVLDVLNKKSGLLGVSGISNDMRTVEEAAAKGDERARLALDLFCYVLAKTIAALVVPLGRLDALVFTGGIGENSTTVRSMTIERPRLPRPDTRRRRERHTRPRTARTNHDHHATSGPRRPDERGADDRRGRRADRARRLTSPKGT
jgi:acetate kinase